MKIRNRCRIRNLRKSDLRKFLDVLPEAPPAILSELSEKKNLSRILFLEHASCIAPASRYSRNSSEVNEKIIINFWRLVPLGVIQDVTLDFHTEVPRQFFQKLFRALFAYCSARCSSGKSSGPSGNIPGVLIQEFSRPSSGSFTNSCSRVPQRIIFFFENFSVHFSINSFKKFFRYNAKDYFKNFIRNSSNDSFKNSSKSFYSNSFKDFFQKLIQEFF